MHLAISALFVVHGIAHLVGFAVPWRLVAREDAHYKTTIMNGKIDVGDAGIRAIGVLWLIAALGFLVCAIAVATQLEWWWWVTLGATLVSFDLTIIGWPESRIGVAVNALIVVLLLAALAGWMKVT
jgi:hypothetical protein